VIGQIITNNASNYQKNDILLDVKLSHFFIPHPETHKKAHLISTQAFLVYIAFFIVLQFGFNIVAKVKPEVLSAAANVESTELIRLTNIERAKNGLPPVKENPELNAAAQKKGENMLAENYWAHFAPSGKSPWDFISGSGYQYSYAGENLARNFTDSTAVVDAWMNSPSHKENIVNSHYQDIGIAVIQGQLLGQQTILVVQEFGKPSPNYVASAPESTPAPTTEAAPLVKVTPTQLPVIAAETPVPTSRSIAQAEIQGVSPLVAGEQTPQVLVDPFIWTKTVGLMLISILALLIFIDIYIIRRRAVVSLSQRHLPHLAMLGVAASTLVNMGPGQVL
jgi:uncharacterized protein YkwD